MSLKYAIITGASSGLGLHFAKWLYSRGGYFVVLGCRSEAKARRVLAEFPNVAIPTERRHLPRKVEYLQIDLTSMFSIRKFVEEFVALCKKGDLALLVNNAGIMNHPLALTESGVEIHFASNFLGHFALTNLLLEHFGADGRILNITSGYYEKVNGLPSAQTLSVDAVRSGRTPAEFYAISKLANCLYTVALYRRLTDERRDIKVVAIRPGFVRGTELGRHFNYVLRLLAAPLIWLISKNIDQGIIGMIHCTECDYDELQSGLLYYGEEAVSYNTNCVNEAKAEQAWHLADQFVRSINTNGALRLADLEEERNGGAV